MHRLSWDDHFLHQRKTGARLNFPQQSEGALKLYIVWKSFIPYIFKETVLCFAFQLFALAESLGGYESLAEHPYVYPNPLNFLRENLIWIQSIQKINIKYITFFHLSPKSLRGLFWFSIRGRESFNVTVKRNCRNNTFVVWTVCLIEEDYLARNNGTFKIIITSYKYYEVKVNYIFEHRDGFMIFIVH